MICRVITYHKPFESYSTTNNYKKLYPSSSAILKFLMVTAGRNGARSDRPVLGNIRSPVKGHRRFTLPFFSIFAAFTVDSEPYSTCDEKRCRQHRSPSQRRPRKMHASTGPAEQFFKCGGRNRLFNRPFSKMAAMDLNEIKLN